MADETLVVDGDSFHFKSAIFDLTIADSFVKRNNKIGSGSGEAKLYVGQDCSSTWDFFGPPSFEISCFMLKLDLIRLLDDLKDEYIAPTQNYRKENIESFQALFKARANLVDSLKDVLWFEVYEQEQIKGNRVYVKSTSSYFDLIRELCFPNITNLTIEKYTNKYNQEVYRFIPRAMNRKS
jgi:putative restriction endonuclease